MAATTNPVAARSVDHVPSNGRDRRISPASSAVVTRWSLLAAGTAWAVLVGVDGSPPWQLARVVAVVVTTWALVSGVGRRWWAELVVGTAGAVSVAVAAAVLRHIWSGSPWVGLSAVVLAVAGISIVVTTSTRMLRGRRWSSRVVAVGGVLVGVAVVFSVVFPAVLVTNVPNTDVGATPADRRLQARTVSVTSPDGVTLAGWYVPSRNGAAVVLRHGAGSTRSDVLDHAAVLARNGYGVLMLDARGHGESGGRAMDLGWSGDADIAAGTSFLRSASDVDPARIGVVGLSMGGEEAIGAAATSPVIRAVVAEGATARTIADKAWLSDEYGVRGVLQEQLERLQYGLTDLLTSADPPTALADAVGRSAAPMLLIAAGEVADEQHVATRLRQVDQDRIEVWVVPGASHTAGLDTASEEWERRVVAFLDAHLSD